MMRRLLVSKWERDILGEKKSEGRGLGMGESLVSLESGLKFCFNKMNDNLV